MPIKLYEFCLLSSFLYKGYIENRSRNRKEEIIRLIILRLAKLSPKYANKKVPGIMPKKVPKA